MDQPSTAIRPSMQESTFDQEIEEEEEEEEEEGEGR